MAETPTAKNAADGVTGTLIWYYFICQREVWLMSRQLTPDQNDENIEWGRFLQTHSYNREKKEVAWDSVKMDTLSSRKGELVVAEVKKSSSFLKSSRMQLLFYLYTLKLAGVEATGELRFPEEKRKELVTLDEAAEQELCEAIHKIKYIIAQDKPPKPEKNKYCGTCAYREFCWA